MFIFFFSRKFVCVCVFNTLMESFVKIAAIDLWRVRYGDVLQERTATMKSFCKILAMKKNNTFCLVPCPSCNLGKGFCVK